MQAFPILGLELFQRLLPDREMLPDALAIEFASHTGELDFTMEGLIRNGSSIRQKVAAIKTHPVNRRNQKISVRV